MESRKELAAEKKRCGSHNCTQSVLCTYCDLTGLDEETIKHAGNCFAAGMGNGGKRVRDASIYASKKYRSSFYS